MNQLARRVADELLHNLKSGTIQKIDIDVVRDALRRQEDCPRDERALDSLEEMTTRLIVMGA